MLGHCIMVDLFSGFHFFPRATISWFVLLDFD